MSRFAVPAALAVALLSLGAGEGRVPGARVAHVPARPVATAAARALAPQACPPRTLPDGDVCVHLPDIDDSAPRLEEAPNAHRDAQGRWVDYDEIPRRPDRPADYDAYRYPVSCDRGCVTSGYDLDQPDELQRRPGLLAGGGGSRSRQVGHGGVDLPAQRGAAVRMIRLEHEEGEAEVVYVGTVFGTTVVTRHAVREGGQVLEYLLFFGHLDAVAPGLSTGDRLRDGDAVGLVGDSGSPGVIHLHLEARRWRGATDPMQASPEALISGESSVACDPRNLLPLRQQP